MTHLYVEHEFKPVGQGLFAFGALEFRRVPKGHRSINTSQSSNWDFTWIYDCGSSSGQALVDRGIREVAEKLHGKLDLIVISHLHSDHISGLLRLLKAVQARTIVFPWAPLWQRLLIGFDQGLAVRDAEMAFYVDPAGYMAGEAEDRFEQIIFVSPSQDGDTPDPDESSPGHDPDDLDRRVDRKEGYGPTTSQLEVPDTRQNRRFAKIFRSGERLVRAGVWEFVPYNDPEAAPKSAGAFKNSVQTLSSVLLGFDEGERADALHALKKLYRSEFPEGLQNDLSLNLYSGPVPLGRWISESFLEGSSTEVRASTGFAPILYTGDANYSTKTRWRRLSEYLGPKRVNAISTFQVPHHGSKYNWKNGIARLVSPRHSVFSSDPSAHYGHPDPEVWREFLPYGPRVVNKHEGFSQKAYFGSSRK